MTTLTTKTLALLLLAGVLTGCVAPDSYPVSGEQCGPNDPVKAMEPIDCVPQV